MEARTGLLRLAPRVPLGNAQQIAHEYAKWEITAFWGDPGFRQLNLCDKYCRQVASQPPFPQFYLRAAHHVDLSQFIQGLCVGDPSFSWCCLKIVYINIPECGYLIRKSMWILGYHVSRQTLILSQVCRVWSGEIDALWPPDTGDDFAFDRSHLRQSSPETYAARGDCFMGSTLHQGMIAEAFLNRLLRDWWWSYLFKILQFLMIVPLSKLRVGA